MSAWSRHGRIARFSGLVLFGLALAPAWSGAGEAVNVAASVAFESHIRPIFRTYCLDCHGGEQEIEGGLDLRLRRLLVKGGESGPAIEPGRAADSLLLQRVRDGDMPPRDKKPSADEVALIAAWIEVGAPTLREEPAEIGEGIGITPEDRAFWAFQPIRRPRPENAHDTRVRTPIDALVSSRLRGQGLDWSPDADKLTLLRRAALDLTGLPPSPEEVAAFLADDAPDAYERWLDRLLASSHYGERWGRHWLDVAGYADSEGGTPADVVRGFAYKYRDYVIQSFNTDKPLDQFIIEQLAGDELVEPPYEDLAPAEIDLLVATGFLRMAPDGTGSGAADPEAARNQVVADTLKIVSASLLGLTVGCAQCHDHRHDPILQADYYRLRAVFEPALDWKDWRVPSQRQISLYTASDREKATEIEQQAAKVAAERAQKQSKYIEEALDKELEKIEPSLRESYRAAYFAPKRSPEQQKIFDEFPSLQINPGNLYQYNQAAADDLKKYDESIAKIRGGKPFEDFLRVLTEVPGKVPTTYLFHRGDPKQPKQAIAPGGLTVLSPDGVPFAIPDKDPARPTSGRRLAFARWLTSGDHPLVARVLANRVWMHHFGRGLVDTPSDFGAMGARPAHPELLDWLASELVTHGWSLKRLHKLIMTSTVYRQTSQRDAAREATDPGNQLLWRRSIQRLEAEIVRDRILSAAGELNTRMFGSPVAIREDDVGQIVVTDGSEGNRRSVYLQVRRSTPLSMLQQFDFPQMEVNCDKRTTSTVSTQSLMLMNSSFILEQAEKFARRVRHEAGEDPRSQVARAWLIALARPVTDAEMERSLAFLARQVQYLEGVRPTPAPGHSAPQDTPTPEQKVPTGKKEDDAAKDGPTQKRNPADQALTNLCQTLLGCHEFLYVD
ncbi:MAG: PSD1 and planctomycete cytochrome C domain-containing protein [Pirellulaceae bacterium]